MITSLLGIFTAFWSGSF